MARKSLGLNPPFRQIESNDGKKEFWNRLTPKNRVDLSFLVEMNKGNRYVIVYEMVGKILGFLVFIDRGDHLYLDLVERNEMIKGSRGAGFRLIVLLEIIAERLGYKRITLSSTQDNIAYYERLGYQVIGTPFDNPDYGKLTPMEKRF